MALPYHSAQKLFTCKYPRSQKIEVNRKFEFFSISAKTNRTKSVLITQNSFTSKVLRSRKIEVNGSSITKQNWCGAWFKAAKFSSPMRLENFGRKRKSAAVRFEQPP
jgi:hypothetical protein